MELKTLVKEGKGDKKRLYATSVIDNEDCVYAIRLFLRQDLICIWNYKHSNPFSYSCVTIQDRLKNGYYTLDKGNEQHPKKNLLYIFPIQNNSKLF